MDNLVDVVEHKSAAIYMAEWDLKHPKPEYISCEHNRFIIAIAYDSLQRPRYKKRCAICWGGMNHTYKRSEALEILAGEPPFDDEECHKKRMEISELRKEYYSTLYETYRQRRQQAWRNYYETYLKSMRWHLLRVKVLTRDEYKCASCKSTDTLQLHHRHYQTLGEESLDDVITLCKTCHKLFHLAQNAVRSEIYQQRIF